MKKKLICAVLAVLVLAGVAAFLLSGCCVSVKRCVVVDGGVFMVWDDRPVRLNGCANALVHTGDLALIVHQSAFAESYPEQTQAYLMLWLWEGDTSDIPQSTIDILAETGYWVS